VTFDVILALAIFSKSKTWITNYSKACRYTTVYEYSRIQNVAKQLYVLVLNGFGLHAKTARVCFNSFRLNRFFCGLSYSLHDSSSRFS